MVVKLRTQEVSWREIDGEMVILDLRTSTYLSANRVGTTLLNLLTEERTTDDLAAALMGEFGIDHPTAMTDTRAFLDDLASRGLLEGVH